MGQQHVRQVRIAPIGVVNVEPVDHLSMLGVLLFFYLHSNPPRYWRFLDADHLSSLGFHWVAGSLGVSSTPVKRCELPSFGELLLDHARLTECDLEEFQQELDHTAAATLH